MLHWHASTALGLLLTGRPRPVCAIVYGWPDCAARRAFMRWADRAFGEAGHCRRIAAIYEIGRAIRRSV